MYKIPYCTDDIQQFKHLHKLRINIKSKNTPDTYCTFFIPDIVYFMNCHYIAILLGPM